MKNDQNGDFETMLSNSQKIVYEYDFIIHAFRKIFGVDDDIKKIELRLHLCIECQFDNYDLSPDTLFSESIEQFLTKYFSKKVFLNPADDGGIKLCVAKDLHYRTMKSISKDKNFCNPTLENLGFELFFSLDYLCRLFKDFSLNYISLSESIQKATIYELSDKYYDRYRSSILPRLVESFFYTKMNTLNLRNRENT